MSKWIMVVNLNNPDERHEYDTEAVVDAQTGPTEGMYVIGLRSGHQDLWPLHRVNGVHLIEDD